MELQTPSMLEQFPHVERHEDWLTAAEYADMMGKSLRTIQNWCKTGFLLEVGCRVRRDATGHWYIVPASR
jgi:hypothetical protein